MKVESMIEIHYEEVQVGQVITTNVSLEPLRVNMVNAGKEEEVLIENMVHVDSYRVELEFVGFVFVLDNRFIFEGLNNLPNFGAVAGEIEFDLKIEKTVKRLRKEAKYHKRVSRSSIPLLQTVEEEEESIHSTRNSKEEVMAEQNLRQLNALNVA
ncbi:hypothetical protein PVK06_047293 [Gossypium arboreum]|uniref:Uncharacterized protein n=1 Tax=Gossypium arboreum TaxID=29729 RepID=A0ABR0MD17_GOSAR|nr:hypothetical protein PVK06_047293 [Gossypium arboreum]